MSHTPRAAHLGALVVGMLVLVLFTSSAPRASFPGANGRIVWAGGGEIWSIKQDGSDPRNLTNSLASAENSPNVSADGSQIVFASDAGGTDDIWVMSIDGSLPHRLNVDPTADETPAWSPNGSQIAYVSVPGTRSGDLMIMNADGSGAHACTTNTPGSFPYDNDPQWSPDGTQIAFTRVTSDTSEEIFLVDVNAGVCSTLHQLTSSGVNSRGPNWKPDGTLLLFDRGGPGTADIWTMKPDGTQQAPVTTEGTQLAEFGAWSPDGSKIVYDGHRDGNYEIYSINADGTGLQRLTNDTRLDVQPDWAVAVPADANIQITPASATNAIGTTHTLTGHVNVNDGTGLENAPDGTLISFAIPSGPGVFVGPSSCTTLGGTGSCTVAIASATTGATVVNASTTLTVAGTLLTRSTGDGLPGDGPNAQKQWVSARISITPNATNQVGAIHTLTATLEKDTGGGFVPADGEHVDVALLDANGAAHTTPTGTCTNAGPNTDASGRCTIAFTSPTPGRVTGHATAALNINGASINVSTDGLGGNSSDAVTSFADANIQLTPPTASNAVNANHTLTGHVNVSSAGGGFVNAPDGTVIDFSLTNLAGATAIFVGLSSCTTASGTGSCTVAIRSPTTGSTTIHATTTVSVGGVALTRATADGLPGDDPDAAASWTNVLTNVQLTAQPSVKAGAERVDPGDIPAGAIPMQKLAQAFAPLNQVDLAGSPLNQIPLNQIGFAGQSSLLSTVLLSQIPLLRKSWSQVLAGTTLAGVPTQSVTFAQALAAAPSGVGAITLGEIDLSASPLNQIGLAAMVIGSAPLNQIPLNQIGGGLDALAEWCKALSGPPINCTTPSSLATETVMSIALRGAPLNQIPLNQIPLNQIPLNQIPLNQIPLNQVNILYSPLNQIPLNQIPLNQIGQIVDCTLVFGCTTGTLGDAAAKNALRTGATLADLLSLLPFFPPGFTFGDLLVALIDPQTFPYEKLPYAQMQVQQFAKNGGVVDYQAGFSVGGGAPTVTAPLSVQIPTGALYKPGSSQLAQDNQPPAPESDPVQTGSSLTWTLPGLAAGSSYALDFEVLAPLKLGITQATVVNGIQPAVTRITPTNDEGTSPGSAVPLAPGAVYFGYIARTDDVDFFSIPQPATPGTRIVIRLGNLAGDNDLVVYGPADQQPRSMSGIPLDSPPVGDDGLGITDENTPLQPPLQQDVPILDITGDTVKGISASRGDADDQVEVASSGSGPYIIQVSGYNGQTSDLPYTLRVEEDPPPPDRVCARTFPHAGEGTARAFSGALNANLNTVFLVAAKRIGDTYGATAEANVMNALTAVAGRTDLGVSGAVIPVESNQAVADAYGAWDVSPCSPQLANGVVRTIGTLIDSIRAQRPTLEYVVLVGSDDIVPMARVPDNTRIANEHGYSPTFRRARQRLHQFTRRAHGAERSAVRRSRPGARPRSADLRARPGNRTSRGDGAADRRATRAVRELRGQARSDHCVHERLRLPQ